MQTDEHERRRKKKLNEIIRSYHLTEKGVEHVRLTRLNRHFHSIRTFVSIRSSFFLLFSFIFISDVLSMNNNEQQTSINGQIDDLAKLSFLNENILLENLRQRYERDLIYVNFSRRLKSKKKNVCRLFRRIWVIFLLLLIRSTKLNFIQLRSRKVKRIFVTSLFLCFSFVRSFRFEIFIENQQNLQNHLMFTRWSISSIEMFVTEFMIDNVVSSVANRVREKPKAQNSF